MVTQSQCTSCGSAVEAGAAFCGACGAKQVRAQACSQCGAALLPGAAFCGACGTAVAQAGPPAAQPAAPAVCASCGTPLREGARFCRVCGATAGAAVAGAPAAAPSAGPRPSVQPRPVSAPALADQITWSSAAAGVGFLLALISVFLAWVSVQGFSVDPLDSGVRFRLGDIIDTDSIDGYVVLLGALGGFAGLAGSLFGWFAPPMGRRIVAGVGGALAALAVIEMQFVVSQPLIGASDIGFGLYVLLVGGLLAAASPWIPARPLKAQ